MHLLSTTEAADHFRRGNVLAYPTEGVYGLGCDPFSAPAVARIYAIKRRPTDKPMILVAAEFTQISSLLGPTDPKMLSRALETWPGPQTWVFPAAAETPAWLTGGQGTLAVRVSAHPVVAELCRRCDHPLISTSANLAGHPALTSSSAVIAELGDLIDGVVAGELGGQEGPTPITDARTGVRLR